MVEENSAQGALLRPPAILSDKFGLVLFVVRIKAEHVLTHTLMATSCAVFFVIYLGVVGPSPLSSVP